MRIAEESNATKLKPKDAASLESLNDLVAEFWADAEIVLIAKPEKGRKSKKNVTWALLKNGKIEYLDSNPLKAAIKINDLAKRQNT